MPQRTPHYMCPQSSLIIFICNRKHPSNNKPSDQTDDRSQLVQNEQQRGRRGMCSSLMILWFAWNKKWRMIRALWDRKHKRVRKWIRHRKSRMSGKREMEWGKKRKLVFKDRDLMKCVVSSALINCVMCVCMTGKEVSEWRSSLIGHPACMHECDTPLPPDILLPFYLTCYIK